MSSTACDFAIALWESVGIGLIMMASGAFFMWLWFIKLGRGDSSENGRKEEAAMSVSFNGTAEQKSATVALNNENEI